jgi:flagellin-specific chaperone FliS
MSINFEKEVSKIIQTIEEADGYLDCEKIIIKNIREQLANAATGEAIEDYLKKLHEYLGDKILKNQATTDCSNYRYASGFVSTLISTPYWHSWINTINL